MRRAQRLYQHGRDRCRAATARPVIAFALALSSLLLPAGAYCDEATLTLDVVSLSFPSSDPDLVPEISAVENPVTVSVRVRGASSTIADLTAISPGDLVSGTDAIAIDRVNWTALGDGFVSGALSKTDPQPVGHWFGKKVDATGALWFRLQNSWTYATGTYSQTVIYTLVSY